MKKKTDINYAKIMLFGEYSVIYGSMALTMPFTRFRGELSFSSRYKYTDYDFARNSNKQLRAFSEYLDNIISEGKLACKFNLDDLKSDLKKGLYFESTIPQGFGLGSSGALCAAVYSNYVTDRIKSSRRLPLDQVLQLKTVFSQLESYFHGTSSGIDPLNSYISFPLLISAPGQIGTVAIPRNRYEEDGAIFLVNTGSPGRTEPLVHLFVEKCRQENYLNVVKEQLIPANNACIGNLLDGNLNSFFIHLEQLSALQLQYLNPMIPYEYQDLWREGLNGKKFYLKLCGSGGGGFLIGFTKNFTEVQKYMKQNKIEILTVYRSINGNG